LERAFELDEFKTANEQAKVDPEDDGAKKVSSVHPDTSRPEGLARPRRMRRETESSAVSAPPIW
jgi:hypothetical protein